MKKNNTIILNNNTQLKIGLKQVVNQEEEEEMNSRWRIKKKKRMIQWKGTLRENQKRTMILKMSMMKSFQKKIKIKQIYPLLLIGQVIKVVS